MYYVYILRSLTKYFSYLGTTLGQEEFETFG